MDEQIANHLRQFQPSERDEARAKRKSLVLISIPGRTQHFAADSDGLAAVERLIAELEATQAVLQGGKKDVELVIPSLAD